MQYRPFITNLDVLISVLCSKTVQTPYQSYHHPELFKVSFFGCILFLDTQGEIGMLSFKPISISQVLLQ